MIKNIRSKLFILGLPLTICFGSVQADLDKEMMICELHHCIDIILDVYNNDREMNEGLGELTARLAGVIHQLELESLKEKSSQSSFHEESYLLP